MVSTVIGQSSTNWNFFVGAAILAGGLMIKAGAPVETIVLGIAVAALLRWKGPRLTRRRTPPRP